MTTENTSFTDLLRIFNARFIEDRCAQIASSLTFTTLLAIVPIVTVALTVAGAFPGFESLIESLRDFVMTNMLPESVNVILTYTNQFSDNAAKLTAMGVLFLGITALLLIFTIDRAFNSIWRVSRPRPLLQRILVYWAVLTVGPLFIGASLSLTSYLLTLSLGSIGEVSGMALALLRLAPVVLTTIAFSLLYYTVPNRPILKRDALTGGIAASAGFEIMKQSFGLYITYFPTYKLVYGAFAAVPIFLLWIYLSWLVVIGGAVLAAVLPEWRERAGQSLPVPGSDFFDALQILNILWRAHHAGEIVTLSQLHPAVRIRLGHLEAILDTLVASNWVARSGPTGWVLSRDAAAIKVEDVYRLFVFRGEARAPARHADRGLDNAAHGISARTTDHMQVSLHDIFSRSKQEGGDGTAARSKAA